MKPKRIQASNPKSRWKRTRAKSSGVGAPRHKLTWRRRYVALQKFVAKSLRKFGVRDVRVLDLGCGIVNNASPVSESFRKNIEQAGLKVSSYVGVDLDAQERTHRGISYICGDILEFINRKNISNPNVIVALRVLEHLESNPGLARNFLHECWTRLPENGILVTDARLGIGDSKSKNKVCLMNVPLAVRKVNGKPEIIFTKITDSTAQKVGATKRTIIGLIFKRFSPENYWMNITKFVDPVVVSRTKLSTAESGI